MSGNTALVKSVRQYDETLVGVLGKWIEAVRALELDTLSPDEQLNQLALPLHTPISQPLDPGTVTVAFPGSFLRVSDAKLQSSVQQRLGRLGGELIASNGDVMLNLSNLAYESASHRTLVMPTDVFDVSAYSALVASALANLLYVVEQFDRHGSRGIPREVIQTVALPLELAEARGYPLRPGDLWVLDLFARTVRLLDEQVKARSTVAERSQSKVRDSSRASSPAERAATISAVDVTAEYLPRFTSISLLTKLLEADHLPPKVAQKSRYTLWPGLETVLGDAGAESLRSLIVGDLSRRVAADRVGLTLGAFFRFVESLLKATDPPLALRANLLIANLLWEIFEQDARAFNRLMEKKQVAQIVISAINGIEKARHEEPPDGLVLDHRRLTTVCACLRSYEQYDALLSVQASLGGLARNVTTSELN